MTPGGGQKSAATPAGVNGLRAVKTCGGFAVAQDRVSAKWFDMPAAAIDLAKADIVDATGTDGGRSEHHR
jgi:hypothetical protein